MANEETTIFLEPNDDPKNLLQVEIGDSKQPDFQPRVKFLRHCNEVNLSFGLVADEPNAVFEIEDGVPVWRGDNVDAAFYQHPVSDENPMGAFEFDLTAWHRPANDRFVFSIRSKNVQFHYQPHEFSDWEKEYLKDPERPDHIKGSYAIYTQVYKPTFDNGKEYGTNKIGHLPRSIVRDAVGNETWTNLNIEMNPDGTGFLYVSLDKDFLDKAVYPIKQAAGLTFGYTSIGGSSTGVENNQAAAAKATPSAGTVSKITAYINNSGGVNVKGVIWLGSNGSVITNGVTPAITPASSSAWRDATYSSQPDVTAVAHYVGIIPSSSLTAAFYDSVGGGGDLQFSGQNFTTPTTFSGSFGGGLAFSIYATYTASSQNYTLNLSGGITPGGVIVKQSQPIKGGSLTPNGAITAKSVSRRLLGGITPAAAILKSIAHTLTAGITPSGAVIKVKSAFKALSGSLTPSGAVVRLKTTYQSLSGSLTPSAIIAKLASKRFTGSVTPAATADPLQVRLAAVSGSMGMSGTVKKDPRKTLTATITPAATVIKAVLRTLAGAFTPSGAISSLKAKGQALASSITPAATIRKDMTRTLTAGITPAGTPRKSALRSLAGSISSSGVAATVKLGYRTLTGTIVPAGVITVKNITRRLTATIASSGIVRKLAGKFPTGTITPAGTASPLKLFTRIFTASITPTGRIADRQLGKSYGSTLPMSGTVSKRPNKMLAAVLGFAGAVANRIFGVIVYWKSTDEAEATWELSDE